MQLTNQFLIASPQMQDPFFAESVVYICEYSPEEGAMGIVINKPSPIDMDSVFEDQNIPIHLSQRKIMIGGPVHTDRGFVLHMPTGNWESSLYITERIALTASKDIIPHLYNSDKVEDALMAMGYSGWTTGQLEQELQENSWLVAPASAIILFQLPYEERYQAALRLLNINLAQLSEGGNA